MELQLVELAEKEAELQKRALQLDQEESRAGLQDSNEVPNNSYRRHGQSQVDQISEMYNR